MRLAARLMPVCLLALLALSAHPAEARPNAASTIDQYRTWIAQARVIYPYRESVDKMYRVMMCESGGNPRAIGSRRWYGLFQYVPSTWHGRWNPYRYNDLYDAKAQIFGTARAWSIGKQHEWSCYHLTR